MEPLGDPEYWAARFSGVEIACDKHMAGMRKAVRFGNGPIIVSPAMYDLIQHANERELEHLLSHLHVINCGPMMDFAKFIPMLTTPA